MSGTHSANFGLQWQGVAEMQRSWWTYGATLALVLGWSGPATAVELQDVLKFTPKQKDVDYEIPKAEQIAKCKVEVERVGKLVGWA